MKAPAIAILMPSDKPRNNYANAWLDWEEHGAWYKELSKNIPLAEIDVPEPWSNAKLRNNIDWIEKTKKTRPIRISMGENGKYVIGDGIHRCNAAKSLGYDAVPAIVTVEMKTPPPPAQGIDKLREERAGWNLYQALKREYPLDWGNVKESGDGFVLVTERETDAGEELSWQIKYKLSQGTIEATMSGSSSGSSSGKVEEVASELARIMSWTKGRKAMSRKNSKVASWIGSICKVAGWMNEFGRDFQVPQEIENLANAGELYDQSWHNDICPSFTKKVDGGQLRLWVGHPDPSSREMASERFVLQLENQEGEWIKDLISTDNVNEVVYMITKHGKNNPQPQPTMSVQAIEERLYDMQKNKNYDQSSQELLEQYQKLTGKKAPGFWQGPYPRKAI